MGALSVVICAILSSIFLQEKLTLIGWIGCGQCIVGSVIIAVSYALRRACHSQLTFVIVKRTRTAIGQHYRWFQAPIPSSRVPGLRQCRYRIRIYSHNLLCS